MTEGLFILTTIFVAYVVYVIVNEQKTSAATDAGGTRAEPTTPPVVKAAVKAEPVAAASVATAPAPVAAAKVTPLPSKAKPTPAAKAPSKAPAKAAAKPKATVKPIATPAPAVTAESGKANGLKDPISGDVATSYSNYRFTKRWIKDALVAEGLLPKVYKNAELDAGVEAQIKEALLKLEAIDKYKA